MSIFLIVIIASIARLAAARSGSFIAAINARGAICQLKPELVLAPAALALLAAVADDRIPVAVGFLLRVGEHLEGDRLVEREFGAAVQPEERLAQHGELHRQHVAGLAVGIIARRFVDRADAAVGESRGVELRGLLGVLVEPQAGARFSFCLACLILSCVIRHHLIRRAARRRMPQRFAARSTSCPRTRCSSSPPRPGPAPEKS